MRNRIAAAAAAGILTIGMAALPSAASASEVAPSTDGLAGSTTISGQIDQDMAVCTDKACDAVQHVRKTNQQIKSDIDTAKQHAEQLHQNAHEDADALRQYNEQAWKNYQEDREDIKNAIDGAVKRGQERHDALHQDMQDTQAHLNQMHADMKETHDELKTRHDAFAASSHQWHQSFIAALKDANSKTVSGRLIRCYRHAWHHGWNECRYDRYWSQRHHWRCAHGCRHWREWCCNWIRHSFRRSNRRVHRRADQVGIWTACTNRHRHFPCLRSHSAACRPCLRHEDVRAV